MAKKYEIVTLGIRKDKSLHPGEVHEFTSKAASILLKMGVIKPVDKKRENIKEELEDGTNNS